MAGCIAGCQYIPSIEYFAHWYYHGSILIEAHENFQKRTWRNKTAILGNEEPLILSVPLKKGKHNQMPITEAEISYDEPWNRVHFNSIQTIYGKTSFYHEIESDIKELFFLEHQKLWDLNLAFIRYVVTLIPGRWLLEFTEEYEKKLPGSVTDLRNGVPAGMVTVPFEKIPVYNQVQRLNKSHFPNLSILDLLCHLGPGAKEYLAQYASLLYP